MEWSGQALRQRASLGHRENEGNLEVQRCRVVHASGLVKFSGALDRIRDTLSLTRQRNVDAVSVRIRAFPLGTSHLFIPIEKLNCDRGSTAPFF